MFAREQLGDPLGERGKAVVIPPIKIPSFDNVIKMQGDNNALMLQAAKYHQEQQQKEAALQLQRDKMAQAAAQKAAADKAKQQAEIFKVLTPETDPLMGDAPKWAAEAYGGLLKEAQELYDRGIDINSFDPEAVAFRSGSLLNYHTNYKRHAEIAKSFIEKQKVWQGKPLEFDAYSLANDDILPYNKSGWGGEYYPKSLTPFIAPMKDADFFKGTDEYLTFDEQEVLNKGGIKSIMGDVYIPKTTKSVPRDLIPLVSNVDYFQDNPDLSPDEKAYKKRLDREAKTLGAFDEATGKIDAELFAQKYAENRRPATKTDYVHQNIEKVKSESDNTSKFIRQFYGNSLIMGTKTTPVAAMPAQSDINAGKNETTGADYLLEPAAEITGTKMNNLPGNTLGANSAWKIGKDGTITPIESNQDIGGITTDRIVYFPTNEQGRPPMSYQNSKTGANKNSSGRFANSGRNYQAFAYKTDKDGNVIVVNLHKSFNGTLSERGIATELTPQEIDQINGRNQVQQPQTPQVKTEQKPQRDGKFNGVKIPGVN